MKFCANIHFLFPNGLAEIGLWCGNMFPCMHNIKHSEQTIVLSLGYNYYPSKIQRGTLGILFVCKSKLYRYDVQYKNNYKIKKKAMRKLVKKLNF